jgi:hypothetical protein
MRVVGDGVVTYKCPIRSERSQIGASTSETVQIRVARMFQCRCCRILVLEYVRWPRNKVRVSDLFPVVVLVADMTTSSLAF